MKVKRKGGFYISRIQHIAKKILDQKLRENNVKINQAQARLLFALWNTDEIGVVELANKISLTKSTVSVLLNKMASKNLVSIEHPPGNNRSKIVKYIGQNTQLEQIYSKISNEMNELFYDGFKSNEIELFENNLKKVYDNLTKFKK